MPRTTRELLLRYADEALNDLQRFLDNCGRIAEYYGDIHPEYRDGFLAMGVTVANVADLLKTFREKFM